MDLFYNSGENEVFSVKIEARKFWTYVVICLLGPNLPNVGSRVHTQGQGIFGDFMVLLD